MSRLATAAALLLLSSPALAKKAPPAPPPQAPNVAAQAMVTVCQQTKKKGTDALDKALAMANGQDPRSQGKPVWDHMQVLYDNDVKFEVTVKLPATISVGRDGVTAFQNACMAHQATDPAKFAACAPKLQAVNLAFAGVQGAVLDAGMAFMLANNVSYGCQQQALTTAANAEKTALLGGGAPAYEADNPHYRQILAGAQEGSALAAAVNSLVATYQAIGDGALSPEKARPVIDALPSVKDVKGEVSDAELEEFWQRARADAATDPQVQQAIQNLEEWAKEANGGVAPPKQQGGLGGALGKIVSGLMSGNLSEAAQGVVGMLPEDNPLRAGVTCVTAILDRDFKTAFKSARNLLPKDSKLRAALDVVPV